jgi:hypothetical protein
MTEPPSFEVTVAVSSPLALGDLPYAPTLDSVLLALLSGGERLLVGAAGEELLSRLHEIIHITETGVPATSALWPDTAVTWSIDRHPRDRSSDEISYWAHGRYQTATGEYTAKITTVRTAYAPIWRWWGAGDIGAVSDILTQGLSSIGARRGAGYGAVRDIHVRADPAAPWRVHGVDTLTLSRPVPAATASAWLAAEAATTNDLDITHHAVLALPPWPTPPWAGHRAPTATIIPILR